jgi:hypothetical protein
VEVVAGMAVESLPMFYNYKQLTVMSGPQL